MPRSNRRGLKLFLLSAALLAAPLAFADHHARSFGHRVGINIVDAYYGTERRSCDARYALDHCEGSGQCDVYASNRLCGDPDRGHRKDLVVRYSCGFGVETVVLREDQGTRISCGGRTRAPFSERHSSRGRGIEILRADYGAGRRFCDAGYAFAQQCNGQGECRVYVSNDLCGDPHRGKRKFVDVEYRCGGRVFVEQAQEGNTAFLGCR